MNKIKTLGQTFTPQKIVEVILNEINYSTENILNKTILEPSFGKGVFLIEIYKRIIEYSLDIGLNDDEIQTQLLNVYGIEIDTNLYEESLKNIYELFDQYNIKHIKLNLYNKDILDVNFSQKFDYIVGNPPYVRVHNMDKETKEKISKYNMSKGMLELYIVFFEICINLLNKTGKLGFITPNSYLKNSSQQEFRNYLINNKLIQKIIDYKSEQIFEDVDTYTAITILNKQQNNTNIIYQHNSLDEMIYGININLNDYLNQKWTFNSTEDNEFLNEVKNRTNLLSDLCTVQYGVATNKDKFYIGKIKTTNNPDIVVFNNYKIEKAILRPVVKASKYTGESDKMIFFPYKYTKTSYLPFTEKELQDNYPLAYKYCLAHKKELEKRDMSKNTLWFHFARTQGLCSLNQVKLVFKHHLPQNITNIKCHELTKDDIVYSGIYIIPKKETDIKQIKQIIESDDFCKYCKLIGKDMIGDYKVVTTKQILEYKY